MHFFTSKNYALVAEDYDLESETLAGLRPLDQRRHNQRYSNAYEHFVLWSLYIVSACVVLSTVVVGFILFSKPATISVALRSDLKKLEWRSSYVDFDSLYGPRVEGPRPIFNAFIQHAAVMAPVSKADASKIYIQPTTYALLPEGGYAVVQSRHMLVSHEVSTIAQFRSVDWGMNNCTIHVVLPPTTNNFTTLNQVRTWSRLTVWLLDSSLELDLKKLSYASKPPRVASLGQLVIFPGVNAVSESFACPRDAFPTIEVECNDSQCAVDVLHTGRSEGGLFLRQAQSVF